MNPATAAPVIGVQADSAMVQYQVRPTNGTVGALADALSADGYDVYGGSAGTIFVHGPASIEGALRARTDLTVVAANPIVLSTAPAPDSQDALLPELLKGKKYETFYGGYRTHDAYTKFEKDLQKAYPKLVKVMSYGKSYTKDNDLNVVCITAQADKGCKLQPNVDKARFLFVAQIHARELTTSEMTWRTMTLLTDKYGKDADITALLDETEIWVIPQINPDGIQTVERGFQGESGGYTYQRKNMHKEDSCSTTQIGTDLNRNYATSNWGKVGVDPNPCGETYPGASAGSEPETNKIQDLVKTLFKDQRGSDPTDPAPKDTTGTLLSLHTYSNLVLFPYGDSTHAPNNADLRSLAFRFSHYNGYETGEPDEILYPVSGSTDDYSYEKLGIASFTFEIGPGGGSCAGFHPAFTCQDMFWDLNREAFLYAARAAQQPYTMGQGPNTVKAKAKTKGSKSIITATADDDAYGHVGVGRPSAQKVTAGRVFVGKAPWDGGKAKAMKVKGSGTSVNLKVKLKRGSKDQLVWIQAKDSAGNWGPTRAVWLKAK
jgi:hypothetical protein